MTKLPNSKSNIVAVILAAERDFGRCPLASRLPRALWPVAGESILRRQVTSLAKQGVKRVIICSSGDGSLLKESFNTGHNYGLQIEFLDEPLPVGTAGWVRDAAVADSDALLLVFPASIVCPPQIDLLVRAHHNSGCDLTVVLNPSHPDKLTHGKASGIYVCDSSLLRHIPKEGYFDIKEGLTREILADGENVNTLILPSDAGNFRDWQEYLCAVSSYLENTADFDGNLKLYRHNRSSLIWTEAGSNIEPDARIYGRVVIMEGACISDGATIFGPTILGRNVIVGRNTVVANSILWDDARVGDNCLVQNCVVDYRARVPSSRTVEGQAIPFKPAGVFEKAVSKTLKLVNKKTSFLQNTVRRRLDKLDKRLPNWAHSHKTNILALLGGGLLLMAFLWSYWPGLADLWRIWQRSDEYSSGLLVPFLGVYILWSRREDFANCRIRPLWWGLLAFLGAQCVRFFGLFLMFGSAERLSIALSVAALVLLFCGWQFFKRVSTILLFLCLMLPWPNRVQAAIALPLQRWATSSAVFCLEVLGYEVAQEGNIIHIGDAAVAVVEACNGLRMVTSFFVVSGLVVLLVKRAWWEKLIILLSSLPIALLCNTLRLAITAVAFTILKGEYWEKIFHDFGGYAMMPVALGVVVAELWLLSEVPTPPAKKEAIMVVKRGR